MKPSTPTSEGRKAEKALRKAVKRVIEENRRLGLPVAVMRNGKPVLIPAEEAMASIREIGPPIQSEGTHKPSLEIPRRKTWPARHKLGKSKKAPTAH